jgi:hypothetical protein
MKITKRQLQQLIKEELSYALHEAYYEEDPSWQVSPDSQYEASLTGQSFEDPPFREYGSEEEQAEEAYLQTLLGTEGYYDPEALTSMESAGPTPEEIKAAERKEYLQALDRSSGIRMMAPMYEWKK